MLIDIRPPIAGLNNQGETGEAYLGEVRIGPGGAPRAAMDKLMPAVGGVIGLWAASKIVPVMYQWDLIPGVASPAYWERANKIRFSPSEIS